MPDLFLQMYSSFIAICVILFIQDIVAQNETRCYADVKNPYVKFAKDTAYDDIPHDDVTPVVIESEWYKQTSDNYKEIYVMNLM